jgi:hypothetical protein
VDRSPPPGAAPPDEPLGEVPVVSLRVVDDGVLRDPLDSTGAGVVWLCAGARWVPVPAAEVGVVAVDVVARGAGWTVVVLVAVVDVLLMPVGRRRLPAVSGSEASPIR